MNERDRFLEAWYASATLAEVAVRLGISVELAHKRAQDLRRNYYNCNAKPDEVDEPVDRTKEGYADARLMRRSLWRTRA